MLLRTGRDWEVGLWVEGPDPTRPQFGICSVIEVAKGSVVNWVSYDCALNHPQINSEPASQPSSPMLPLQENKGESDSYDGDGKAGTKGKGKGGESANKAPQ